MSEFLRQNEVHVRRTGLNQEASALTELIGRLRALDVKLWLEDGRLKCSVPQGVLTAELKDELKSRKDELIRFLQSNQSLDTALRPAPGERTSKRPSFAQQRLWFLHQMEPENANYNIWGLTWINGPLNAGALERSMMEIIRRHESLRTAFVDRDGEPEYVVGASGEWEMATLDFAELPLADAKENVKRLAATEAKRPFDLSRPPLVRAILMRCAEEVYGLFFCVHHIVADGLSLGVFFNEFTSLYQAFCESTPASLPELPFQYSDFVRWQRDRWQRGELAGQLDYWKEQLGGSLPILELPADRLRPAVQTFSGSRCSMHLSKTLTDALREVGRQEKSTVFMVLMAAFQSLLYRCTGVEDVLVGTPVLGRCRPEFEPLIGFFANTLVLRTDLSGNPSFRQLLGRVCTVALEAYANQDVPFDQVVEAVRPARNVSHSPIFQVMFSMHPVPLRSASIGGVTFTIAEDVDTGTARFDLAVDVIEKEGGLKIDFEYNTDLFDRQTILRLQEHFERLLDSIVKNPDQRIGLLEILTEPEREQILFGWNQSRSVYPTDICIHQLIEEQVRKTPGRVALEFEDVRWTYAELNRRADQLAFELQRLGVGPEVMVGVYLERSPLMILAVLATLKAGGAYVPLDPAFPPERLQFMLADSKLRCLLTQEHLKSALNTEGIEVICLDSSDEMAAVMTDTEVQELDTAGAVREAQAQQRAASRDDRASRRVTSANLAYVIYTSGSTGKPKGVEINHRSVVNFLLSMAREPGLRESDTLLSVTTLSFDIAGLELYLPLIVGARLVLAGRSVVVDASRLSDAIAQSGATVMQATPATWKMLVESGWSGKKDLKILCGGEALSRNLANQLCERAASVWNMYGPTETTIWSLLSPVTPVDGCISIGQPIANTQAYVLDRRLQPVPAGVVGELFIGGDGLARGYLNRPELTSERFIPDPFNSDPAARLYRTGDLARYYPDGALECLGRTDHQVKIRGFRIELGEIEASLNKHPDIRQAVVAARQDSHGEQRLVAYLITSDHAAVTAGTLRQYLKKDLPDYMIPSSFAILSRFPLTPNGKVDRNALPASGNLHTEEAADAAPAVPGTYLERTIAAVWREVLDVECVGLHDNFFDLGGHSLLVVKAHNKLRSRLECDLTLLDMFQSPTVASLARLLSRQPALADARLHSERITG